MGKHSDNAIEIHTAQCGGKLSKKMVEKKNLGGKIELHTCPDCPYVGWGEIVKDKVVEKKEVNKKEKK